MAEIRQSKVRKMLNFTKVHLPYLFSCVKAEELADEYEQVRKQDCGGDAKGQAQRP